MLRFRSTREFCEPRCAGAGSPDPSGVTERSQGWSPPRRTEPLVYEVPNTYQPRPGRRNPPLARATPSSTVSSPLLRTDPP